MRVSCAISIVLAAGTISQILCGQGHAQNVRRLDLPINLEDFQFRSGAAKRESDQRSEPSPGHTTHPPVNSEQEEVFRETSIYDCALIDSAPCVDSAIARGELPDAVDDQGLTPLFIAVGADSRTAARALIVAGANPDLATSRGVPSEYALVAGTPEMIQILLEGDPARADALLLRAARDGDIALLRTALSLGGDPSATDASGATALAIAVAGRQLEIARELIEKDASKIAPEGSQAEPLAIAILIGDAEALDLLLSAGAHPDRPLGGLLPLELASMRGDIALVERLLAAGADPSRRGADGSRPGDFAAAIGQEQIARRLKVLEPETDLFALISKQASREDIRAAIESGADVNRVDLFGMPPVVLASASGRDSIVMDLAAAGADLTATSPSGLGILAAALGIEDERTRRLTVSRVLIEAKARHLSGAILRQHDESGRSAAVLLATRIPTRVIADQQVYDSFDSLFEDLLDAEAMRAVANEPDADGVSPFAAAVLANNYRMTRYFSHTLGLTPPVTKDGVTLQEIARSRRAWAALAGLPDDRIFPGGLGWDAREAGSAPAKRDLQRRLKEWGYYAGGVDAVIGPGSLAALVAFFEDRETEVLAMARAVSDGNSTSLDVSDPAIVKEGATTLTARWWASKECTWMVVNWKVSGSAATKYVGCKFDGRSGPWNANSIAMVTYGDGLVQVERFGPRGWDEREVLQ